MKRRGYVLVFSIILLLSVAIGTEYNLQEVQAKESVKIIVPQDAKVYENGKMLGADAACQTLTPEGRIFELATETIGEPLSYYVYEVDNLDDVTVLDWMQRDVHGELQEDGSIDYTMASEELEQSVTERVEQAAAAYYNRVAGFRGNADLAQFFQTGSDAYEITINSDAATKWGRFLAPAQIKDSTCLEIIPYSDTAFVATARVISQEMNGFTEQFDIHMLFQNQGSGWYVTQFTFAP